MRLTQTIPVMLLSVLLLPGLATAQSTSAGRKITGEALSGHEAQTYQRHARERAELQYNAQLTEKPCPPQVTKAQAAAIRENVAAASKSLKKVQEAHAKDAEVEKLIAEIEKHHSKVVDACVHMETEADAEKPNADTICDCCADMVDELKAAEEKTAKLLKHLKIEKLAVPKKIAPKIAPKKGSKPAAKDTPKKESDK